MTTPDAAGLAGWRPIVLWTALAFAWCGSPIGGPFGDHTAWWPARPDGMCYADDKPARPAVICRYGQAPTDDGQSCDATTPARAGEGP